MQETILAANSATEQVVYYASLISDFHQRMSASKADDYLGIDHGSVNRAWKRGEIQPYVMPDHPKRALFTPLMLAEWLDKYCRPEVKSLPG